MPTSVAEVSDFQFLIRWTVISEINQFVVVSGFANTGQFLDDVRSAADADRNALGFTPAKVYEEFARRDRLYVLVEERPSGNSYAGHLLFELRYPRAHVLQMHIAPTCRRGGRATVLISRLRDALTSDGFTAIYARVAEDLTEANIFWDRQQFYIQRHSCPKQIMTLGHPKV